MSENTRSGYDIRTDLLGMAIGILESSKESLFQNEHMKPEGQRQAVSPYVPEDVLEVAEKLYSFVEKKD